MEPRQSGVEPTCCFFCKGQVVTNPKMKPWREQVGGEALKSRPTSTIWAERHVPVKLSLYFCMPMPKKPVKNRPTPSVKPDIDKLCRACLDAMSGILYVDDGQVTTLIAQKTYSVQPRLTVIAETDWLL